MDRIYIKDLIVDGSYPDAGAKLYTQAVSLMSNNNDIMIDMEGVDAIPTTFMNMSFGKLILEFGKGPVKKSLKFFNISRSQLERIKKYFDSYE